jgi:hypothetical protein
MRKFLAVSMAALTLGTTIAAGVATPAAARSGYYDQYGRWHSYRRNNNNSAAYAIAGGIVGLALGAALSSSNRNRYGDGYYNDRYYGGGYNNGYYNNGYYNGGYYDDGYYGRNYYGGYGDYGSYGRSYRTCTSRRTVWDPYIGAYITKRFRYAC